MNAIDFNCILSNVFLFIKYVALHSSVGQRKNVFFRLSHFLSFIFPLSINKFHNVADYMPHYCLSTDVDGLLDHRNAMSVVKCSQIVLKI